MRTADIKGAMRLKEAAAWNQVEADWMRLLRLEPEGCFVDERAGVVAGTATAVRYGSDLAWIGMVLVHPEFRRRGIARALMQHTMGWLSESGVATTRLDATDMGRPLYKELGFSDEEAIERWERTAADCPAPKTQSRAGPLEALEEGLAALDCRAFGYDRSALIQDLVSDETVVGVQSAAGFAMGRPGSRAWFVGPCVACSATAAEALLSDLLAQPDREHAYWDLLPANAAATRLASGFGFRPVRRLVRMVHTASGGAASQFPPGQVFATAGFEFG